MWLYRLGAVILGLKMTCSDVKLSDLLGKRIIIDQTPVPRVPGELEHERKQAYNRIMYLRQQKARQAAYAMRKPANRSDKS